MVRSAFSMIELIFVIVITAIAVTALTKLSNVGATTSYQNIKYDEAIFEAYVKALETTDETFDNIVSSGTSSVLGETNSSDIAGLKFDTSYKVDVITPTSFGEDNNSLDIKKVILTIYDSDGNVLTKLYTYKFNL